MVSHKNTDYTQKPLQIMSRKICDFAMISKAYKCEICNIKVQELTLVMNQ